MKVSNTVVTVVVIAAVLIFAYGVGMLIRQARTGGSHASSPTQAKGAAASQRPGPAAARTKDTPEERLRLKEARAKDLEKMSSGTDEEKAKLRDQVIKQVGGRRGGKKRQALPPQKDVNTPTSPGGDAKAQPSTDKGSTEPGKAGPG
jgi:hypothetical protein